MKFFNLKEQFIYATTKTLLRPVPLKFIKELPSILIEEKQLDSINNTTNNVIVINTDGGKLYFRRCRVHSKIRAYVFLLLEEFCYKIQSEDFKNKVFSLLQVPKRFKRFANMGMENDSSSRIAIFQRTHNAELVGLTNELYNEYHEEVDELVKYVWGELVVYKLNSGAKKNSYQTYNSSRCLASYAVANFFELYDLMPKVEYCQVHIKNSNTMFFGTVMESAKGISPSNVNVEDMRKMISPILQKELMELNVIDTLCFQKDHRPDNFNIKTEEGKFTHISVFDNDAPATFSFSTSIDFSTYIGCSPIVKDGFINRPHVSKSLYDKFLSKSENELRNQLKPYINRIQMNGIIKRFRKIKNAFIDTQNNNHNFAIEDDYWSEITICDELSGEYGITYLGALLQDNWRKE